MADVHEQIATCIVQEANYEIRLNWISEDLFLTDLLVQPEEVEASRHTDENRTIIPAMRSLIDVGNKYRQRVFADVLHHQQVQPYGRLVYDYLRLTADESLFIQALITRNAKLIAICLPRVPTTQRLLANCPKDLLPILIH